MRTVIEFWTWHMALDCLMKGFSRIFGAFLLCVVLVHSTEAGEAQLAFSMGEPMDFGMRMELAIEWRDTFQKLDKAIPTLSPSQLEWLREEHDEELKRNGNRLTPRVLNARDSKEYNLRVAKSATDANALAIELLATGHAKGDPRREARYWAILAINLADHDTLQALLKLVELGVIDRSLLEYHDMTDYLLILNYQYWGHLVLSRIIFPYLADRQPD